MYFLGETENSAAFHICRVEQYPAQIQTLTIWEKNLKISLDFYLYLT